MADDFEPHDLTEEERVEFHRLDTSSTDNLTEWMAPGDVSQAFLNDTTLASFIMGPVGSAKTTTACFKRVADGAEQGLGKDGWVRDRSMIFRRTWRTAKSTVLKSWGEWFHKAYPGSTWTGGEDRPATHILRFIDSTRFGSLNPVKVELETDFLGLDDNSIEQIMRGRETSRIMLDEVDQFSVDVLSACEERTGRYPKREDLVDPSTLKRQVIGAFNAPDKSNWLYDVLVENRKPTRMLHTQPAGLLVNWNADGTLQDYSVNQAAENLHRLADDYYTSKAVTWEDWRLRRFILNEWGYSRDGLPVFVQEFRERLHVAKHVIAPNPDLPLIIGADGSTAGLRPAAVLMQPDGAGFLNVIMTIAPGHGFGAARFWELVKETVDVYFRGCRQIEIWADPASQYGGDREGGQLSFHDFGQVIMGQAVRIPFGGSNEIGTRLQVIRDELLTVVQGEARRLRISPHPSNKPLINGFASLYRFKKRPPGAPTHWEALPEKNEASDPMDALGYGVGGLRRVQGAHSMRRQEQDNRRGPSTGGWGGRRNDFDPHRV